MSRGQISMSRGQLPPIEQVNVEWAYKWVILGKVCKMLVYKHTETMEYLKEVAYFLRKIQTLRQNNSRIFKIKNMKFSGYYFYMN